MSNQTEISNAAVAIATIDNANQAALYFDRVVPIFIEDFPRELLPVEYGNWEPTSPFSLFTKLQNKYGKKNIAISYDDGRVLKLTDSSGIPLLSAIEEANERAFIEDVRFQRKIRDEMSSALIPNSPIIITDRSIQAVSRLVV